MKETSCRRIVGLILLALVWGTGASALAADAGKAADSGKIVEVGKFEVVAGSDDKAYLVDKVTGAVWVLTYRTMATGREPIAIPYKFILRTPKNQGEFLAETPSGAISMPPTGGQQP
ncbi:MAG: hypothetical protein LLG97_10700 [Deltaproteobacteria bacterium]|nr:hypothetical protein [Deltaproteobacteria bacterium]